MENLIDSRDDESARALQVPHPRFHNATSSFAGQGTSADDSSRILMSFPLPLTLSPPFSATDSEKMGSSADRQAEIVSRTASDKDIVPRTGCRSYLALCMTLKQPTLWNQPLNEEQGFDNDLNVCRSHEAPEMSIGIRKESRAVYKGACLRNFLPTSPKAGFEQSNDDQSANISPSRSKYDEELQTLENRIIKELGLEDDIPDVSLLKSKQGEVISRLLNAPYIEREVLKKIRLSIIQRIRKAEAFNRKQLERSRRMFISRGMEPIFSDPIPKLPNQYLRPRSKRSGPTKPRTPIKTTPLELDDWDTELKPHQRKKPTMKGEPNDVEITLIEAGLDVVPESLDYKKPKRPKNIWETLQDYDHSFFSNLL